MAYTYQELRENYNIFTGYKSRDLIPLICFECEKEFKRPRKNIGSTIRSESSRAFCSKGCISATRKTAVPMPCTNCGEVVERKASELKKVKNVFCSRSCAATVNGRLYPKRNLEGSCIDCNVAIPSKNRKCSPCQDIERTRREIYHQSEEYRKKVRATNVQSVMNHRQRRKAKAVDYKGGSCMICNYDDYAGALHFHHLDPSRKDFSISSSGRTMSWKKMKLELDKCILLCAICHAEVHAGLIDLGMTY